MRKIVPSITWLNNPPDNWHFMVAPLQKIKTKQVFFWGVGRWGEFWDKIVNFGKFITDGFLEFFWILNVFFIGFEITYEKVKFWILWIFRHVMPWVIWIIISHVIYLHTFKIFCVLFGGSHKMHQQKCLHYKIFPIM